MPSDIAPPPVRLVVVDDDTLIRFYLTEIVEQMGHEVVGATGDAASAVALCAAERPDVVLMDVRLGGRPDGIDAAAEIAAVAQAQVVFITGSSDPATVERMKAAKPLAVLYKPILPEQLARVLRARPAAPV